MKVLIIASISLSLLSSSCSKTKTSKPQPEKIESVDAIVTGDPISFYNSKLLVFPVGGLHYETDLLPLKERNIFFKSSTITNQYDASQMTVYNIADEQSQEVNNLIFYNKFTKEKYLLSDSSLSILSFGLHREFEEDLIFYEIVKTDINGDSIKNSMDGKILYISKTNGKGFIQLSPDSEMYLDYFFYPETNTILVKSLIDSNKDGIFLEGEETRFTEVDLANPAIVKDIFTDDFKDVLKNMALGNKNN